MQTSPKSDSGLKKWLERRVSGIRKLGRTTVPPEDDFPRFKVLARSLSPFSDDFANREMLTELLQKTTDSVSRADLDAGHLALVGLMPEQMLRARFGTLAEEYETVTKNKPFALGTLSIPPTTLEGWRSCVVSLTEDIVKFRCAKAGFERMHSSLGILFGIPLIGFVLAGFFYADHAYRTVSSATSTWQPVLFCGVTGAAFSVLMRLYSLRWTPRIAAHFEDLQALRRSLIIDCVLSIARGTVAAGVLYLLFVSALLKEDIFPQFTELAPQEITMLKRFYSSVPASPADVAKLLVWVFIAGFAERFVPDKLNRLAGEASAANEKK